MCDATRDTALDLVSDDSAQTFINSFKIFISLRDWPQVVLSDNGSKCIGNSMQEFLVNCYIQ